jgi:hypothetical protein
VKPNTQEIFFSRTIASPSGDCLLWTGAIDKDGYGFFRWHGKYERAHRLVWQWNHGPIDSSICVLHKCDVPACVLIDHLFIGTQQDNMADKVSKNRQASHERMGAAKLDREKVAEIRSLYNEEEFSLNDLAERFGVSKRAILFVIQGKTWR